MRRLSAAVLAASLSIGFGYAALAADMPVKAPVYKAVEPSFTWTGFYAGINGGGGWGKSQWSLAPFETPSFGVSGGMAGGQLGYNWQSGAWVFGIETDLDWANIKGSTSTGLCGGGDVCTSTEHSFGSTRARLGYTVDHWLLYVTGGVAYADLKGEIVLTNTTPVISSTNSKQKVGWTAGVGGEYAISGPWSVKAEYLYADLGKFTPCNTTLIGGCIPGFPLIGASFRENIVRVGLNYRFGSLWR
jgi:outer membrane immunogenic protein